MFTVPVVVERLTATLEAVVVSESPITLKYMVLVTSLAVTVAPVATARGSPLNVTESMVGGVPSSSLVTTFTTSSLLSPAGRV